MKNGVKSLIAGAFITLSTFGLSYAAATLKFIWFSHILYWQGWWLQTFIPCLNVGAVESSACEGTPLNLAVFLLGLPFGMILYSLLAYGVISCWSRRAV